MAVSGVCLSDSGNLTELLDVAIGVALTTDGVFGVVRDFDPEHGSLKGVDPEVATDEVMEVFWLHAVVPEDAGFVGEGIVLRDQSAGIAEPAEVFAGEETVGAEIAHGAAGSASIAGADGLGGVFDDF